MSITPTWQRAFEEALPENVRAALTRLAAEKRLGGKGAPEYLSFEDARIYARNSGVKDSREWRSLCPRNIPLTPDKHYKEFVNWADWLGTNLTVMCRHPRSFEEAKAYAQGRGFKSKSDWFAHRASLPVNIPRVPEHLYKDEGWVGWGDFLGTGYIRGSIKGQRDLRGAKNPRKKSFRSFEDARAYVRNLGLHSREEWRVWRKSGRPSDIPSNPNKVYAEWNGIADWLGI